MGISDNTRHTPGHIGNCPGCDALRRSVVNQSLDQLTFKDAWPLWYTEKQQHISPVTRKIYGEYRKALTRFFAELPIKEIHIGHIIEYREQRLRGWHSPIKGKLMPPAGPSLINHEINCLAQILARAGLWAPIQRFYKPLRVPKTGPGRALQEQEALWLLEVASTGGKGNRWKIAYLCSLLSANTACGPGEIRKVRIKDLDISEHVLNIIEGAKNDYRVRPIPLNADALWAAQQLLELAAEKGSYLPNHYLLPHRAARAGEKPDPTRPMGTWKKAWSALRKEAAKRYPSLATFRMYDLRHHALTTLLENPAVSEQTIKDIAGHVSKKILERYSHIRLERKKAALEALEGLRKPTVSTAPIVQKRERVN